MKVVTNLRSRLLERTAFLVLPSAFAIVCTVGVVAAPAVSLHATKSDLVVAQEEVLRLEDVKVRHLVHAEQSPLQTVRSAKARLDAYLPDALPSLELHGLIRAVGEAVGLELEAISIGSFEDPGLERLDDYVARRRLNLRGYGDPGNLTRLLDGLRRLGLPVAVTSFECAQSDDARGFSLALGIEIYERSTPPLEEEEGPPEPSEE